MTDPFLPSPWDDSSSSSAGCARRLLAALVATVTIIVMAIWGVRPVLRATVGPTVLAAMATLALYGFVWTRRHPDDDYTAIDDRRAVDDVLRGGGR